MTKIYSCKLQKFTVVNYKIYCCKLQKLQLYLKKLHTLRFWNYWLLTLSSWLLYRIRQRLVLLRYQQNWRFFEKGFLFPTFWKKGFLLPSCHEKPTLKSREWCWFIRFTWFSLRALIEIRREKSCSVLR